MLAPRPLGPPSRWQPKTLDLAGKVDATTTAMLTATTGNVSSTGALEIEGSAVTVSGPVLAATNATITATAADATLNAVTATTGAIGITANTGNIDVGCNDGRHHHHPGSPRH